MTTGEKKALQMPCPGCGLIVLVEHDGKLLMAHHQVPPCQWFETMLRQELGTPDAVTLTEIEVDS